MATYEPKDGTGGVGEAVDGNLTGGNGWRVDGGQTRQQLAIFALEKPITASIYQIQLSCLSPIPYSHPACFSVDVTTDPNPSKDSTWTPLIPRTGILNDFSQVEKGGVDFHGGRVVIRPHKENTVLTLRSPASVGNVTAFCLRLFPYEFDSSGKLPATVGCNADGGLILTELTFESDPLRTTNIALGRVVKCSGPIVSYLPAWYLTDGFASTFTHPENREGEPFYFELDLASDMDLDHIVIKARNDGVSPERLSNFRVQLLGQGDMVNWEATIHGDGTNPGVGGSDRIVPTDGQGYFRGRKLRILNHPGQINNPQVAELEVYPSLQPTLSSWVTDGVSIVADHELNIPARKNRLDFAIAAKEPAAVRDLINYRWKVVGWDDAWRECDASGQAFLSPLPPVGHYRLIAQARHTDGTWDQSEANIAFTVEPPWWQRPNRLIAMLTFAGAVIGGIWWGISSRRMKGQLTLAQERLNLNKERLRIARDMHDDMGARLTSLALLADRCRRQGNTEGLDHLAREARDAVESLDEIVWSVNPRHDTVGSLCDHLQEHTANYLNNAGIRCYLESELTEREQPLGLAERHHLLMASKEALQNIVKHAEASEVHMQLHQGSSMLSVEIRDNGKGLTMTSDAPQGDGLANMCQRLQEAGGRSEIESKSGEGTTIRFHLPLKTA